MAQFDELRAHGQRLSEAGYRRRSIYLSPEVDCWLAENRQPGESMGATIERLLCFPPGIQPPYRDAIEARREEREFQRRIRRAQNQIEHSRRAAAWGGPVTLCVTLYRKDRKGGVVVTGAGLFDFEGECPP